MQVTAAGSFKHVWPFSEHCELEGQKDSKFLINLFFFHIIKRNRIWTPFLPSVLFWTPWKRQEIFCFPFQGGIKSEHQEEIFSAHSEIPL